MALAAAVLLVLLLGGCEQAPESTESVPATPATSGLPTLIELGSSTCGPCKMMAPILDELAETFEGTLTVIFIDTREDTEVAARYRVSIIPTQIFFDAQGNELLRHQGFFSREDILAAWAELGYAFEG